MVDLNIATAEAPEPEGRDEIICVGCGSVNKCRTIRHEILGEAVEYDAECTVCGSREVEETYNSALMRVIEQRDALKEQLEAIPNPEALRLGMAHLKALCPLRNPPYELPADSFLEMAVRYILALRTAPGIILLDCLPSYDITQDGDEIQSPTGQWIKTEDLRKALDG